MEETSKNKVTIYRTYVHQAPQIYEVGWRHRLKPWEDTQYYKGEDDGGKEYYLPEGVSVFVYPSGFLGFQDATGAVYQDLEALKSLGEYPCLRVCNLFGVNRDFPLDPVDKPEIWAVLQVYHENPDENLDPVVGYIALPAKDLAGRFNLLPDSRVQVFNIHSKGVEVITLLRKVWSDLFLAELSLAQLEEANYLAGVVSGLERAEQGKFYDIWHNLGEQRPPYKLSAPDMINLALNLDTVELAPDMSREEMAATISKLEPRYLGLSDIPLEYRLVLEGRKLKPQVVDRATKPSEKAKEELELPMSPLGC